MLCQLACAYAASTLFGSDWVPTQDCNREHLPFLASVATFLNSIAQHNPAADRATPSHGGSSSLHCPANWQSPSQSEWDIVLTTRHRFLMTLRWLFLPGCTKPFMHDRGVYMQCLRLQKALWRILHSTLIGHVQNLDLQLETVALYLLVPATYGLAQKEMRCHQPLMELLSAFFMRLARDSKLIRGPQGSNNDGQGQLLIQLWQFIGMMLLPIRAWYQAWSSKWCCLAQHIPECN